MDRHKKYREEQKEKRRVRVSAYVPEEDRDRALKYLERLRKKAKPTGQKNAGELPRQRFGV